MPTKQKDVKAVVLVSEHVTEADKPTMAQFATQVADLVRWGYEQGFIATVDQVNRPGAPLAQGNWDLRVRVRKENPVR